MTKSFRMSTIHPHAAGVDIGAEFRVVAVPPAGQNFSKQQKEIVSLVTSGQKTGADAARLFRVHPSTVARLLARHQMTEIRQT